MIKIKDNKLKMYDISNEYKKYLSKFDAKVSLKDNRKFYGILINKKGIDYYIPLTSKIHKKTTSKLTINIKNFKELCCNFKLLEQKCREYNAKNVALKK